MSKSILGRSGGPEAEVTAGETGRARRRRWREAIRQLSFPPAWRIGACDVSEASPTADAARLPSEPRGDEPAVLAKDLVHLLGELATGIWRTHRRLTTENSIEPEARLQGAIRHAEATLDAAKTHGLTIRDYVGERWKAGLDDVSVLARERHESPADTVVQAQRPALVLAGHPHALQRAEVILSDGPVPSEHLPSQVSTSEDDAPAAPQDQGPDDAPRVPPEPEE